MTERLPDFLVIGAIRSGTTTLYRWLEELPDVHVSVKKEPRFFSEQWDLGPSWYAGFFAGARPDQLVGEASPQYTTSEFCDVAAPRIAQLLPDVRLVYLLRHPIERLLSEYRYNLHRKFAGGALLEQRRDEIVGTSCYHARLSPYIERFPREQICVVRFEDMVADGGDGWAQVLTHLGLPDRPSPRTAYNATSDYPVATPMTRRLSRVRRRLRLPRPPVVFTGALARYRPAAYQDPLEGQDLSVLDEVAPQIWADVERLEDWLGVSAPLWPRSP